MKLLVISSYPPSGETHHKAIVGVASYTKNTLNALFDYAKKHNQDLEITVLAEKLEKNNVIASTARRSHEIASSSPTPRNDNFLQMHDSYQEGGIRVKRIWQRSSLSTYSQILKETHSHHKDTKQILLELELAMFGEMFSLLPLPFFLLLLRLMGKQTIVVIHQVVNDIAELSGHIDIKENSWKIKLLNITVKLFYFLVVLFSSRVIVFDKVLKDRLGNKRKVLIIPHGVEAFSIPEKHHAREKLRIAKDSYVLLYFGFLAWYKGTDWLVNAYKKISSLPNIQLIIAGGPNPNHKNKEFYQKYIAEIEKNCKEEGITLTGFVPEEQIPLYFAVSDLILFPYRTLMSASGPLSMAFSFHKPFLVRKSMQRLFATQDSEEILEKEHLNATDFTFEGPVELSEKIQQSRTDRRFQNMLTFFSSQMAQKRSWNEIGRLYYETIFEK